MNEAYYFAYESNISSEDLKIWCKEKQKIINFYVHTN